MQDEPFDTEKQALTTVAKQWDEAMLSNDADRIVQFMSDDWVIIGEDGITEKNRFLAPILSGILTHSQMNSDEIYIKLYGNIGIVISKGISAGLYHGQSFYLYEWSTNVFQKINGKWLCVLTMLCKAK